MIEFLSCNTLEAFPNTFSCCFGEYLWISRRTAQGYDSALFICEFLPFVNILSQTKYCV